MQMTLRGFDVKIMDHETTKYVRFDIKTGTGSKNNMLIECGNVYEDDYYDGITGNEEYFLSMKFITNTELNKNIIDDQFKIYP